MAQMMYNHLGLPKDALPAPEVCSLAQGASAWPIGVQQLVSAYTNPNPLIPTKDTVRDARPPAEILNNDDSYVPRSTTEVCAVTSSQGCDTRAYDRVPSTPNDDRGRYELIVKLLDQMVQERIIEPTETRRFGTDNWSTPEAAVGPCTPSAPARKEGGMMKA